MEKTEWRLRKYVIPFALTIVAGVIVALLINYFAVAREEGGGASESDSAEEREE